MNDLYFLLGGLIITIVIFSVTLRYLNKHTYTAPQKENDVKVIEEIFKLTVECLCDEITSEEFVTKISNNYSIHRKTK